MQPVVTAEEMRALDRTTIEDIGLPALTLMETAGRAVADAAVQMIDAVDGQIAVVCGPGNNGGDGFVAARVLRARGFDALAYLAVPRARVQGPANEHLTILERSGGVVRVLDTAEALGEHRTAIARSTLVVDAVFGIGLTRRIEGHLAEVIALINTAPRRLAVDIPSGLHTDTGETLGDVVDAHRTVTMAALKIALVSSPGFARCGTVSVADIGVPPSAIAALRTRAGFTEQADVRALIPHAVATDHKGRRGHVIVIGGAPTMRGAGRLAAIAALRMGAGLVTLAHESADGAAPDSVMTQPIHPAAAVLGGVLDGKHAVVIGPGLGTAGAPTAWVGDVLEAGIPAVLDADALNVLASALDRVAAAAGPVVITPHPGEAARLLATTAAAIEADRLGAARALAIATKAVVVLKGARTIVCDGTQGDRKFCWINPTGGPELATAGSGDVLAGAIGALLAQGLAAVDAARVAVFVHGRAGQELVTRHGGRGVISSDLPEAMSDVVPRLDDGLVRGKTGR